MHILTHVCHQVFIELKVFYDFMLYIYSSVVTLTFHMDRKDYRTTYISQLMEIMILIVNCSMGTMVRQQDLLAAKHDELGLMPGIHRVEGRK